MRCGFLDSVIRSSFPLGVTAAVLLATVPPVLVTVPASANHVASLNGREPSAQAASWARWAVQLIPEAPQPQMKSVGATRTTEEAVAFLLEMAEAKAPGYWQQCLRLADDAYMPDGPRVASAALQWERALAAGVARVGETDPPIGAHMFFDPGHASGHIVTYVGDGLVVSNLEDGTVGVVKWHKVPEWGDYLGWAPPYYA